MIFIAHRGNLEGPNPDKENHPDYLTKALEQGFSVEVDVWVLDGKVYLGHDGPVYEATNYFQYQGPWHKYNGNFRDSPSLWIHCKNFEALNDSWFFHSNKFAHQEDDFVLISNWGSNYIWTYPRNLPLSKNSIAVMPERVPGWDLSKAYGICTDYVLAYQKDLNFKI
jgi:hypothetical protein